MDEYVSSRRQGANAPSSMVSDLSGITRSGSISIRNPNPVQSGHAPYGVLKEKSRGSSSDMDMSHEGHEKASE